MKAEINGVVVEGSYDEINNLLKTQKKFEQRLEVKKELVFLHPSITNEQYEWLYEQARKNKLGISAIVRKMLDDAISKAKENTPIEMVGFPAHMPIQEFVHVKKPLELSETLQKNLTPYRWTSDEDALLKNLLGDFTKPIDYVATQKYFPNRTRHAVKARAKTLGLTGYNRPRKPRSKNHYKKTGTHGMSFDNRKRMSVIGKKIQEFYVKGYSLKDASKLAWSWWYAQQKQKHENVQEPVANWFDRHERGDVSQ